MSENEFNELSDNDSRLMDSLLDQSLRPDDGASVQRVQDLISAIRSDAVGPDSACASPVMRFRWFPISALAVALVVFVVVVQPWGRHNEALAAVERSIHAELRPEAREYEVTIVKRGLLGAEHTSTHSLFVRQREFAIRASPRLGNGEIWMGRSNSERWIVPRFGPVLVGSEGLLNRSLPSRPVIETPFLSVGTILDRMKRFYTLKLSSGVSLQEGNMTVICDHIFGTRKRSARVSIPAEVQLWADTETGFARRIELRWGDGNTESRWLQATAVLVGTHELPGEFFKHSGHHDSARKVNQISE